MTSSTTTSADGTTIAYAEHGAADAPAIVWVHGATSYRALNQTPAAVAELTGLRVLEYDRRGRGESSDTAPYAIEREIDDIAALIDVLGGRVAALVGESSGAILALRAALAGVATDRVVAYEPPFIVNGDRPPLPADYVAHLDELTAAGDFAGAHRYFLTAAVGLPAEFADGISQAPFWPLLEPVAPTIAYDGRITGDLGSGSAAPLALFAELPVPVLVAVGSETMPFMKDGAGAFLEVVPDGRIADIPGGSHQTDPALVAPVIDAFVRGRAA
jgi:pimeloyl-ACP methyl ester carboxylesterase